MKLLTDTDRTTDGRLTLEIPWVEYIRTQGYTLRSYEEIEVVESNSRDACHVVAKIETYLFPKNSSLLDVANPDHQVEVWTCSCEDFTYNKSVDVGSDIDITPDQCDSCRHIESVSKVEKAKNDDNQDTLV